MSVWHEDSVPSGRSAARAAEEDLVRALVLDDGEFVFAATVLFWREVLDPVAAFPRVPTTTEDVGDGGHGEDRDRCPFGEPPERTAHEDDHECCQCKVAPLPACGRTRRQLLTLSTSVPRCSRTSFNGANGRATGTGESGVRRAASSSFHAFSAGSVV